MGNFSDHDIYLAPCEFVDEPPDDEFVDGLPDDDCDQHRGADLARVGG